MSSGFRVISQKWFDLCFGKCLRNDAEDRENMLNGTVEEVPMNELVSLRSQTSPPHLSESNEGYGGLEGEREVTNPAGDNTSTKDSTESETLNAETFFESKYAIIKLLGVICAILLCSVTSKAAVQSLNQSVPHAEMNVSRYICQPFLVAVFLCRPVCSLSVERSARKWVALLFVVYICNVSYFGCVYYLALGTANAVLACLELTFLWLVSTLVFREVQINRTVATLLAFASVLLVVQPPLLFGQSTDNSTKNVSDGLGICEQMTDCYAMCRSLPTELNISSTGNSTPNWRSKSLDRRMSKPRSDMNDSSRIPATENNSTSYSLSEKGGAERDSVIGYTMVVVAAISTPTQEIIISRKLRQIDPLLLLFWVGTSGLALSTVQMLATEIPTFPDCWFCALAMIFHAATATGFSVVIYVCVQKMSPLLFNLILTPVEIIGGFGLQYTVLSGMHPGHRNWAEYTGIAVATLAVICGPLHELWRSKKRQ